jgi:hypothetical protein
MYKVVVYYDNIYPIQVGEYDTLEEAQTRKVEALEKFDLVSIWHEGEEVK